MALKKQPKKSKYLKPVLRYLLNIRKYGGGFSTDTRVHNRDYILTDILKSRVRDLSQNSPFFIYGHYGAPHHPYTPPLAFIDAFLADTTLSAQEARDLSIDLHENIYEIIANGCNFSDNEWAALTAMYDAEILYSDFCIGQLVDYIQDESPDNTVVVITADHGEFFGEHGMLSHKVVPDDALLHVPLVIQGDFVESISHQKDELVQHADLIRTLLEIGGVKTESIQGIDLRYTSRDFTISQRGGSSAKHNLDAFLDHNPDFDTTRYISSTVSAFRTEEFKFLMGENSSHLYNLPDEYNDVQKFHPDILSEFKKRASEWLHSTGSPITNKNYREEMTEDMKEQLRELGYLDM